MQAKDLVAGDEVLLTVEGTHTTFHIASVRYSDEKPGYITVSLKEPSNIIRVLAEKTLDFWGQFPVLL